jgi:hypothetical protein
MHNLKLDFTLEKYRQLCTALLASGYQVCTVVQYLSRTGRNGKTAVLRHDVDRKPGNALRMAILEQSLGIISTYYFRMNKSVFKRDMIKTIAGMGHEIGYHYEALDKAKGNYEKAIKIFERELAEFRKVADVKTICMHGNPLTKWDNRDLWSKYDFRSFGLVGEAYLSFSSITYLSDTGRTWSSKYKVKDRLPSACNDGEADTAIVDSTDDCIALIKRSEINALYLLVHPERWSYNMIDWTTYFILDTGVTLAKRIFAAVRTNKDIEN